MQVTEGDEELNLNVIDFLEGYTHTQTHIHMQVTEADEELNLNVIDLLEELDGVDAVFHNMI